MHEQDAWPMCSTRQDLSSLNVLVCGDDVFDTVGWETARWIMFYWEYTMA